MNSYSEKTKMKHCLNRRNQSPWYEEHYYETSTDEQELEQEELQTRDPRQHQKSSHGSNERRWPPLTVYPLELERRKS
nr:MAG: hypothetical protein [Microvirus sp.]